jgi:hypothetical protein
VSSAAFERVVSVCTARDQETWKVASSRITQCIAAKEYQVIVPDHEVALFQKISGPSYRVLPESTVVGSLKERLRTILPLENQDRVGWYLQQFIKIAAARAPASNGSKDGLVLIWDADTVPLKQLRFINDLGRLMYYQGSELHQPYFDFIKRAFGLNKKCQFSFIAQCFPAKIAWVDKFCADLENSTGLDWMESILFYLDPAQPAGFSEYESLGTYIWDCYPNQVALSEGPWQRNGRRLVGKPDNVGKKTLQGLAQYYDYISFEAWDVNRGFRAHTKAWWNRLKLASINPH